MSIDWNEDEHGHWTLIFNEEKKVRFLTPQQKEDLQVIFNFLLDQDMKKSENLDD